ncbi:MAG: response regulator [Gammaproteobacteria bacterium]|nr:response regulator [Gammaproteobacteria bacterium]
MSKKILVVDDIEHVRKLFRKILQPQGYDVIDFPAARPALDFLENHSVDLIVSDLMMPEMDGYAFCRKVKSEQRLVNIPFVFVTAAFTDDIDKELAERVGAEGYITKPVEPQEFISYVNTIINRTTGIDGKTKSDDGDVEKMYTEVLARKLDKKVVELESERAALRDSEYHLRTITNAIPELVSELDKDGIYCYVNKEFENWFGLSVKKIIGMKERDLMGEVAYQLIEKYHKQALSGNTVTYEEVIPLKDGVYRAIWGRYIPKKNEDGEVVGVYCVVTDITERRHYQDQLEDSNRSLRILTEVNKTMIHASDESALFSDVCKILVSIADYQIAWITMLESDANSSMQIVADAGDASVVKDIFSVSSISHTEGDPISDVVKSGVHQVLKISDNSKSHKTWITVLERHGLHSMISVPIKQQQKTIGAINICSESTDAFDEEKVTFLTELSDDLLFGIQSIRARIQRDYAIRSLKDSEHHLRSIVDTAPSIILWLSTEGDIHGVNREGESILGISQENYFGKSFVETFVSSDSTDEFRSAISKALSCEPVRDVVIDVVSENQTPRDILWNMNCLSDENEETIGVIAVGQDITEQRIAQKETQRLQTQLQQAQKMEAIGQLTGGIAHDFNNILASIIGYTELALERYVTEESGKLKDYLSEVHRAGTRAKDLIAQMLAFSRSKHGELISLKMQPLVKETTKLLRPTIPANIEFKYEIGDVANISADPIQIQQVIMNLCINARDAVGAHGVIKIKLSETHIDSACCDSCHQHFSGDYLVLSVSDSGHGISRELVERIFEPFFTSKEVGSGTGMGLSMVHGIVHHHKGHIVVKSEVDVGTDFQIFFPLISSINDIPMFDKTGKTILIVDDEESVVRFLEALLKNEGYTVVVQTDSRSALKYFESHTGSIDLVFSDQTMPRMSGLDMAREILKLKSDVPIILATGHSTEVDKTIAIEAGIATYLNKPFDTKVLLKEVESLIK